MKIYKVTGHGGHSVSVWSTSTEAAISSIRRSYGPDHVVFGGNLLAEEDTEQMNREDTWPAEAVDQDTITKPTVEFAALMVKAFYMLPGNGVGGNLHIVVDDLNYEKHHVEWCRNLALEKQDADGVFLCDALLTFSDEERCKVLGTEMDGE